jgi:hypothetical protein
MGWEDDPNCRITVTLDSETEELVKNLLDPKRLPERCRCFVRKHPDCCALCRANNSCLLIPMHFQCRCVRVYECF